MKLTVISVIDCWALCYFFSSAKLDFEFDLLATASYGYGFCMVDKHIPAGFFLSDVLPRLQKEDIGNRIC